MHRTPHAADGLVCAHACCVQDGSADAVVRIRLAPSYVTYIPAAVRSVVDFFVLPLGGLQEQQQGVGALQVCSRVVCVPVRVCAHVGEMETCMLG